MPVEVKNFGCRLNVYEGEVIKQQAHAGGLKDAIVFNSCVVTKEAERQVKQAIRKARREHPNKKLIVTGCSAQIDAQQYIGMEEVSAVLGNEDKLHAENYKNIPSPSGGGLGRGRLSQNSALDAPLLASPPVGGGTFARQ